MLNPDTRNILSQLGAINNSMIIGYPKMCVIMGKSMQAFVDLEKLKEDSFDEIGVYNFNEFNSVVNVIENPIITNDNGTLTIKNSNSSIKYGTISIDILESECRGNPELVEKIKTNELVIDFELGVKDLDKIKKMSGLLKDLSDLNIESKNGEISLTVTSTEKSSNNFIMGVQGVSTEDVKMTLIMDLINKLPSSVFKVQVFKSKKGSLVSVFSSQNVDGLDIIISAKAN